MNKRVSDRVSLLSAPLPLFKQTTPKRCMREFRKCENANASENAWLCMYYCMCADF